MIHTSEVVVAADRLPASGARLDQAASEGACALAIAIAAAFYDRGEDEIRAQSRSSAATCEARHTAIYLAHIVFQRPLREVAEAFSRDRTSIGHALRRVEDRRDDATFDAFLTRLERLAMRCRAQIRPGEGGRP